MNPSTHHAAVWAAIDEIARQHKLSPSRLAINAGLDATSFNLSKRFRDDGRPRWPNTESIMMVLAATGTTWEDFGRFVDQIARGAE